MVRKSFLNRQEPVVTLLINGSSLQKMLIAMRQAEFDGADAITLQLDELPLEERTTEMLQGLFSAVSLPIMCCLYRNDRFLKDDDDARQPFLLNAIDAGAEFVDVMGDLFDPSPFELTHNESAIKKQIALINEIHNRGGKVIMSSHMPSTARSCKEIVSHLQEQASRGADIVKIVTGLNTEEDLLEALKTDMILSRTLNKPFVHVCGGKYSRIHRFLSPKFGSSIAFAVNSYDAPSLLYTQPTIRSLRSVLDNLPWHIDDMNQ